MHKKRILISVTMVYDHLTNILTYKLKVNLPDESLSSFQILTFMKQQILFHQYIGPMYDLKNFILSPDPSSFYRSYHIAAIIMTYGAL